MCCRWISAGPKLHKLDLNADGVLDALELDAASLLLKDFMGLTGAGRPLRSCVPFANLSGPQPQRGQPQLGASSPSLCGGAAAALICIRPCLPAPAGSEDVREILGDVMDAQGRVKVQALLQLALEEDPDEKPVRPALRTLSGLERNGSAGLHVRRVAHTCN